jgi:hypothetical protein
MHFDSEVCSIDRRLPLFFSEQPICFYPTWACRSKTLNTEIYLRIDAPRDHKPSYLPNCPFQVPTSHLRLPHHHGTNDPKTSV